MHAGGTILNYNYVKLCKSRDPGLTFIIKPLVPKELKTQILTQIYTKPSEQCRRLWLNIPSINIKEGIRPAVEQINTMIYLLSSFEI